MTGVGMPNRSWTEPEKAIIVDCVARAIAAGLPAAQGHRDAAKRLIDRTPKGIMLCADRHLRARISAAVAVLLPPGVTVNDMIVAAKPAVPRRPAAKEPSPAKPAPPIVHAVALRPVVTAPVPAPQASPALVRLLDQIAQAATGPAAWSALADRDLVLNLCRGASMFAVAQGLGVKVTVAHDRWEALRQCASEALQKPWGLEAQALLLAGVEMRAPARSGAVA